MLSIMASPKQTERNGEEQHDFSLSHTSTHLNSCFVFLFVCFLLFLSYRISSNISARVGFLSPRWNDETQDFDVGLREGRLS